MPGDSTRLLELFSPASADARLESFVATTYNANWEFIEQDLLPVSFGLRPTRGNLPAFRSELERMLETCEVSILYDLRASDSAVRWSPRIDPIPISERKLHSKITLLLWRLPGESDKRVSLLVGSANLTHAGFRENYEVMARLDFGGPKSITGGHVLKKATTMLRQIAGLSISPQLDRQLNAFEAVAARIPSQVTTGVSVLDLVDAPGVLAAMEKHRSRLGRGPLQEVVIVSPFWPEDRSAAEPIAAWLTRMGGISGNLEMICRSAGVAEGQELPELPRGFAEDLHKTLGCRVLVRPTKPDFGIAESSEKGEEEILETTTESQGMRRQLHAKLIILRGDSGDLLYCGSSNFTRRGLALSGAPNWEAGLIYSLQGKARDRIAELRRFAADKAFEVTLGKELAVAERPEEEEPSLPLFLRDIVVIDNAVRIGFERKHQPISLEICIPAADATGMRFRLLKVSRGNLPDSQTIALDECVVLDAQGQTQTNEPVLPGRLSSWAEIIWDGKEAKFPVRFDSKDSLPLILGSRALSERELIEFYKTGIFQGNGGGGEGGGMKKKNSTRESTADTSRILSYHIRDFVEALPGLQASVMEAKDCAPALRSCLLMHASACALAERAVGGLLTRADDGPSKTTMAVAFQLVELAALITACSRDTKTPECRLIFSEAQTKIQAMLEVVRKRQPEELESELFKRYEADILRVRR
jgi:hypothetical protein